MVMIVDHLDFFFNLFNFLKINYFFLFRHWENCFANQKK